MRVPALIVLTLATIAMTSPARAQTYDPRYPVCLKLVQNFGGERYDCRYVSLEQCQQSQGGLPAQCVVNPFYGNRRR